MNAHLVPTPRWSSAMFNTTTDATPMDLSALGSHLALCRGANGRLLALQGVARNMRGFMAARFVTTLLLLALLIGAVSLVA